MRIVVSKSWKVPITAASLALVEVIGWFVSGELSECGVWSWFVGEVDGIF